MKIKVEPLEAEVLCRQLQKSVTDWHKLNMEEKFAVQQVLLQHIEGGCAVCKAYAETEGPVKGVLAESIEPQPEWFEGKE